MQARKRILTNGRFEDGVETKMKIIVSSVAISDRILMIRR